MAVRTSSERLSAPLKDINSLQFLTAEGPRYLEMVSDIVDSRRNERYALQNPPGFILRIAALEDTIYRDEPDEVYKWGKFYLPEMVNMQVFGVVEGSPCPSDELILMTCEDKRLYAFDGEELHVVGLGLDQLKKWGIKYPSDETYYNGEAFKDMTKEDWEEVKRGDVGKKLEEEHKKLVESHKSKFLENLQSQK